MREEYYASPARKKAFLNCLQVWSNHFQKAMLLKTALCDDPVFIPIFHQHYVEEFGHDKMLANDASVETSKDPLLEALCCWFPSKMLCFDNHERIVAMNLCVEAAAAIFYEYSRPAIDPDNQLAHFQAHDKIDHQHERMGIALLEYLTATKYQRLLDVQRDAWAMCEALMSRIAELSMM